MIQVIKNIELQAKIANIHFKCIAPTHKSAVGYTDEEEV